jgi:hypothetical protein
MSGLFTISDYEWTKQMETNGFNQEFINEIYDMPEALFIQNVLNHTLPEMSKLSIPEGTRFPVATSLNTDEGPPKLMRTLTQVPDTFHEWLYQFRFMLQYFTIKQMFNIFYLYDFTYGVNEPNAWVDNALEQMYNEPPNEEYTQEHDDEFLYNLNWDIEKGNLSKSSPPKLRLFLPEDVGMVEDETNEETQPNTLKQKRT